MLKLFDWTFPRDQSEPLRWLLHYTNQKFEDIGLKEEDWAQIESLAPRGKVPFVIVNDQVYAELRSVSLMIARSCNLLPSDRQVLFWSLSIWDASLSLLENVKELEYEDVSRRLKALARQFDPVGPFSSGQKVTIADISIALLITTVMKLPTRFDIDRKLGRITSAVTGSQQIDWYLSQSLSPRGKLDLSRDRYRLITSSNNEIGDFARLLLNMAKIEFIDEQYPNKILMGKLIELNHPGVSVILITPTEQICAGFQNLTKHVFELSPLDADIRRSAEAILTRSCRFLHEYNLMIQRDTKMHEAAALATLKGLEHLLQKNPKVKESWAMAGVCAVGRTAKDHMNLDLQNYPEIHKVYVNKKTGELN